MYREKNIEFIETTLNEIRSKSNNKEFFTKNLENTTKLKDVFKQKLSSLIESVEFISKQSNTEEEEIDEDSPASIKTLDVIWPNGTKVLVHEVDSTHETYTSPTLLPEIFSISIRVNKLQSTSHITFGFSDRIINLREHKYIGLGHGHGNLGIVATGYYGLHGNGKNSNVRYKEGDIITFNGNNGIITVKVNDQPFPDEFDLGTSHLYLSITLYYINDCFEILS